MEPTLNIFIDAVEKSTLLQIEALSSIDNLHIEGSEERAFFVAFGLLNDDIDVVVTWLKYIVLGLVSIHDSINSILANTESDEEALLAYLSNTITNLPVELQDQIISDGVNKNLSKELPQFVNTFIKKVANDRPKDTSEILSSLATPNKGDSVSENQSITKDDILAGIENPTETVKTPSFALPKSKPQTTNILSSLAKPADPIKSIDQETIQSGEDTDMALGAIVDPFLKSIGNSVQTPNQIHTSENEKRISTADILSGVTMPKAQNTPAQDILETMDTKLQQVQGSTPTETYKVADTPRHDPYREIPSM